MAVIREMQCDGQAQAAGATRDHSHSLQFVHLCLADAIGPGFVSWDSFAHALGIRGGGNFLPTRPLVTGAKTQFSGWIGPVFGSKRNLRSRKFKLCWKISLQPASENFAQPIENTKM